MSVPPAWRWYTAMRSRSLAGGLHKNPSRRRLTWDKCGTGSRRRGWTFSPAPTRAYRSSRGWPCTSTPRSSRISPPTKLQTFFFGIVITWIWVDSKHDVHRVTCNFHPLDQRPDEVPFARPVGDLQAVVEFGGKVLQTANNQLQFALQGGLISQRLALLLQPGEALAQAGNPGLKLGLIDEALRITVDQPGHALAHLADLVFEGGQ